MSRRSVPFQVADVFTAQAFQGNPVGVVLQAAGLQDREMGFIAAELGCGQTAFLVPVSRGDAADLRIRWFTPTCELSMSGHGAIAAVHVLDETGLLPPAGRGPCGEIAIETAAGMLWARVERSGDPGVGDRPLVWLDLPAPVLTAAPFTPDVWAAMLRACPEDFCREPGPVRSQDGDLIVFVKDFITLNALRPRHDALEAYTRPHRLRGLCAVTTATLDPSITTQCRYFAAGIGIPEDPVTGGVHGPIAAHLITCGRVGLHGDLAALTCTQASPAGRGGLVRVLAQRQSDGHVEVRIGGECVTTIRGELSM